MPGVALAVVEWMAWTRGTLVFVAGIFAFLASITALAIAYPSAPRKGFLPMATARGDRIYISLLGTGLVMVLYVAATDLPLPFGLLVAAGWIVTALRWG
jgi:predicted small integral membrane protein